MVEKKKKEETSEVFGLFVYFIWACGRFDVTGTAQAFEVFDAVGLDEGTTDSVEEGVREKGREGGRGCS